MGTVILILKFENPIILLLEMTHIQCSKYSTWYCFCGSDLLLWLQWNNDINSINETKQIVKIILMTDRIWLNPNLYLHDSVLVKYCHKESRYPI